MYINDLFTESNEMDTPEFQAALLAMKKRAAQEPPVDLKRLRQRMDAADRAEQAREKRKQERRATVDENAWSDGSNSWSSEHDQWTKENSNNPMPIDSASAIPGRVREGAGVFNIGDQVLYKGQPAEVLAVDGTAATVYVPNWKAVPGMVDDTMEVDPASKFLNPMDPSVAEGTLKEFAPNGFGGFEDDDRVPMHFIVQKELYNRRARWKKTWTINGVKLFTTKSEAIHAAEKFNKLDPNREYKYGGTQLVDVDIDENKQGVAEGEMTAYQKLLKQMKQNAKNDPNRIPRGYELTAHGELVKKSKTEKSNDGVGGLGEGVAKAAKQKTPGVALSKAYRKDFDGKKPGHDRPETALTGAYSKTGKPGGALKKAGVGESTLTANTPDPIVVVQDRKGNILDTVNLSAAVQKYRLGNAQNIKNQLAHQNYTTIGNYVVMAPMGGQPQDKTTQGIAENTNYWHKLQAERNTRINSLITELKESIK